MFKPESKYTFENIIFKFYPKSTRKREQKSLSVIGIDTEADETGKCFLMCTSLGDSFNLDEFPDQLFSKKYRGKHFVAYNLKYDEGHILRFLPREKLQELREKGETKYLRYEISYIPRKMLKFSMGKYSTTFWDIFTFFHTSLDKACKELLGKSKIDIGTKSFTTPYIKEHLPEIEDYCIQDAKLVQELATELISHFERFQVFPRKLFSTAYISAMYFSSHCEVPSLQRFCEYNPKLVQYSMNAYHGGKFEVTEKGIDTYYEYDINSAYPYEMSNLIDISHARVIYDNQYHAECQYGFLHVNINITSDFKHPITVKINNLCIYPIGNYDTFITKQEYDYLKEHNIDVDIIDGAWLYMRSISYPFRKIINQLYEYKSQFKLANNRLDYYIVKLMLNSWYGKFIQLIDLKGKWKAGAYFNPIYASIVTANTRLRVSRLQEQYPSVCACFTDSVISNKPLDFNTSDRLGDWNLSASGDGVILGSGIYQIGDKIKFRGFETQEGIWWLLECIEKHATISHLHVNTWREVVFRGAELDEINRFIQTTKEVDVNFDHKRIWLNDWAIFTDIRERKVQSVPRYIDNKLGLLM